jgi:cyanophycinase-like exopeptidase
MMAFLCRQLSTGQTDSAWGLGVNDGGAVLVDRDGQATVFGDTAYWVHADRPGARCLDIGTPLTYTGFKVWRLEVGERYDFNLNRRPRTGFYLVNVDNGVLSRNPYQAPTGVDAYANARRTPDRESGR